MQRARDLLNRESSVLELNAAGRRSGGHPAAGTRTAAARTHRGTRLAPLKGAASVIGLPYTTLRDAARRGEFPIAKIGRADYVEWTALDRWIESNTRRG